MKPLTKPGIGLIASTLALLGGCTISTPFQGPGYDRSVGVTEIDDRQTVVVALTHAVVGDSRRNFDRGVEGVVDSLESQPGLIGYSLRRELLGNEAWTLTVWRDEASLDAFVRSPAHRQAIQNGMGDITTASFRRIELPAAKIPIDWESALEYLAAPQKTYGK